MVSKFIESGVKVLGVLEKSPLLEVGAFELPIILEMIVRLVHIPVMRWNLSMDLVL